MRRRTSVGVPAAVVLIVMLLPASATDPMDALMRAETALGANRLAEAEAGFRDVLSEIDTGGEPGPNVMRALSGLGTALVLGDRPGEARAHLERALRIQQRLAPADDLGEAELLHGLAWTAVLEQRRDDALALVAEELVRVEAIADEQPERTARARHLLLRALHGRAASPAERAFDARELELYERALATGRLAVPPEMEQVLRDSNGASRTFRMHALRAIAISSEPIWRDEAGFADSLRGVAASYAAEGDTGESLRWFERAWSIAPPARFESGFAAYGAYPRRKAFAMALDANGRWTYGFFTGEKTTDDAVERALGECRRRLPWLGIDADCRIYALDERIVWEPVSIAAEGH